MKSNFHLEASKKNQEYHIHLHGVFDGASAFELIEIIRDGEEQGLTMFIDTSRLKEVLPFGQTILNTHLPRNEIRAKLNFKGVWAGDILPAGCNLLSGHHEKGHKCTGNCKNCRCRQDKTENSIKFTN